MEGSSPRSYFGVRHERRNGIARLLLTGELDLATAPMIEEQMALVEADGANGVLLDLRDLTFVDSTGLYAFVRAWKRATANGHAFAVVAATSTVNRVFKLTGIDAILQEADGLRLLAKFEAGVGSPVRLREREPIDG